MAVSVWYTDLTNGAITFTFLLNEGELNGVIYDMTEEFNVDPKAECDQLNLAHETKTNNRQCPLSSVQVEIREGRPKGIRVTMEERICERDEF